MTGAASRLVADRVFCGRYRLVRLIDKGGMAEVWEGRDEVLARPVAIKVLDDHLARDQSFAERFRREAVAAARLAHPNIVATFDAGTEEGISFIVMELVRGETLHVMLEREGPLEPARAVAIVVQVADALHYAHNQGLIHRDVKPANVLLCREADGSLSAKVADFGIAREAGRPSDLTATDVMIGTAEYLAPEQVQGTRVDPRTDVYSLGVVLFEVLCGRPPFVAEDALQCAMLRLQRDPPRPRRLRPGIPRPLEAVVLRALERDPGARQQSAAVLRNELAALDVGRRGERVRDLLPDPGPPPGVSGGAVRPAGGAGPGGAGYGYGAGRWPGR